MRLNPKIIGVVAVAAVIATAIVLLIQASRRADNQVSSEPTGQEGHTLFAPARPSTTEGTPGITSPAPIVDTSPLWVKQMDAVLRDNSTLDGDVKADKLIALFPSFPEAGQLEAIQHIINLTSDEHYAAIGRYVTNTTLPEDVMEELFDDLLNRPNAVKLPKLLEIARNPQHPDADEAKDVLELYLEEDYAGDWWKWEAALNAWLKDNPD